MDQDGHKDDGSVWTSYSDMFTTMAIIFLVMFVFALIKLGVTSIESITEKKQHKDKLEGLIPESEKKRTASKIEQAKKSLKEVATYRDIIDQKMEELALYADKLQDNKQVIEDILKDQESKEAMLESLRDKLAEKRKEAADAAALESLLKKKVEIQNIELQERLNELSSKETEILEKEQALRQLQDKYALGQSKLENARVLEEDLRSKLDRQKQEKGHVEKELEVAKSEISQNLMLLNTTQVELKTARVDIKNLSNEKLGLENLLTKKDSELKELNLKKSDLEFSKKEVEVKLAKKESELVELEGTHARVKEKQNKIEVDLRFREQKLANLMERLEQTEIELESQKKNLMLKTNNLKNLELKEVRLEGQVANLAAEKETLENMVDKLSSTTTQLKTSLIKEEGLNTKLRTELNDLKGKLKRERTVNEGLNVKVSSLQSQLGKLSSENMQNDNDLGSKNSTIMSLNSSLAACEEEKDMMAQRIDDMSKLSGTKPVQMKCPSLPSRSIASAQKVDDLGQLVEQKKRDLRAEIARKLAAKFAAANVDVTVDPETGNVTLMTGHNFLFKTNSDKLNDKARKILKKLIPLYAEVLFSDEEIREKIGSFNVEGHASPSYGKKYINPYRKSAKAYSYNLNLSAKRAAKITDYVFGPAVGDYKYKWDMRTMTQAIGYGYSKPIPLTGRSLASYEKNKNKSTLGNCGPFHCEKSQRVELSFTLKDDISTMKKLLNVRE